MLGESRFPAIGAQPYVITLGPYGYYWFRLQPPLSAEPLSLEPELVSFEVVALAELLDSLPVILKALQRGKAQGVARLRPVDGDDDDAIIVNARENGVVTIL